MSNIWKLARRENHVCAVGSVAGKIAPLSHGSASRVDADGVSLLEVNAVEQILHRRVRPTLGNSLAGVDEIFVAFQRNEG